MDLRTLGYVLLTVQDLDDWVRLFRDVVGADVSLDESGAAATVRVDSYAQRIRLESGAKTNLVATGWEVASNEALEVAAQEIERAGVGVRWLDDHEVALRRVERGIVLEDPSANVLEIYVSPQVADSEVRLHADVGGFVTDDMGLGHVVLSASRLEETSKFWQRTLGFLSRDSMLVAPPGVAPYRMRFLACNPRHHSVALTEAPAPTGLRHLMLHMSEVIDVGRAFDRASGAGLLKTSIGQHSNDLMLSFYLTGPGGIDLEIATLGARHDNASWSTKELIAWKAWGYEPPVLATNEHG